MQSIFLVTFVVCYIIFSCALGIILIIDMGYITGGFYVAHGLCIFLFLLLTQSVVVVNNNQYDDAGTNVDNKSKKRSESKINSVIGVCKYIISSLGILIDVGLILLLTNVINGVTIYRSIVGKNALKCLIYNYSCESHVTIFGMRICNYLSPQAIGETYFYYLMTILGIIIHAVLSLVYMLLPINTKTKGQRDLESFGEVNPITDVYDHLATPSIGSKSYSSTPSPKYQHSEPNSSPDGIGNNSWMGADSSKKHGHIPTRGLSESDLQQPQRNINNKHKNTIEKIPSTSMDQLDDVSIDDTPDILPNNNLKLFSPL